MKEFDRKLELMASQDFGLASDWRVLLYLSRKSYLGLCLLFGMSCWILGYFCVMAPLEKRVAALEISNKQLENQSKSAAGQVIKIPSLQRALSQNSGVETSRALKDGADPFWKTKIWRLLQSHGLQVLHLKDLNARVEGLQNWYPLDFSLEGTYQDWILFLKDFSELQKVRIQKFSLQPLKAGGSGLRISGELAVLI